ncbi:MAG TPA: DUF2865 domain-containing protein [Bauldia sp.]|nr:DUF2865 domain-containing protein [Bauldia sp.]
MNGWKLIVPVAGIAAAVLAAPASATGICDALSSRLAVLDAAISGATARDPDLDRAILRQRYDLDRATVTARRSHCTTSLFSAEPAVRSADCAILLTNIDRMRANLDRMLAEQQGSDPDPFTAQRERNRILRQLSLNDCSGSRVTYGVLPFRGMLANLFAPRIRTEIDTSDGLTYPGAGAYGTYRTVCVRTCDGYFFPISQASIASRFSADADACRAACPGAPTALYVQPNPSGDPDAMTTPDGEPYSALPAAFRYRREFVAACTCHPTGPVTGTLPPAATPVDPTALRADPGAGEDPETLADRTGKLDPTGGRTEASDEPREPAKAVRIVGPSYYVAQ